jgi:molybdopterin converting factor small subunit
MRVTVHYMAQLKRTAGCSCEQIEVRGPILLGKFLRVLGEQHGPAFRTQLLDDQDEPRKSLLYFVGDDHADFTRPLQDGDAVTILAPMAGG